MEYLLYNGFFIEEDQFVISPNNRAFSYGDGLFETLIMKNRNICFLEDHIERLHQGLKILQIEIPEKLGMTIGKDMLLLASKNNLNDARIKLYVWRKTGGLFEPESNEAEFLISTKPYRNPVELKEQVVISKKVKLQAEPWSKFKHINSAHYVMAGLEKKAAEADDIILLNHQNIVTECLYSNIWWIDNNTLYTPDTNSGCIEGVMRKNILRVCEWSKIPVEKGLYNVEAMLNADTVFTSNVNGISYIRRIENKGFGQPHYLYEQLRKEIQKITL